MKDNVLLLAVRRMDAEALAKVFDLYAPAIYKYAFRHCRNAVIADQIVGDVFEKLLEHLSRGCGPNSNLRSYLFEMAYHLVVDEVRRFRRTTPIGSAELRLPAAHSPDLTIEEKTQLERVVRAIRNDLTDDQRHVMVLRFLEGFSVAETATIMGKKEGNVKVIQTRAVAALRRSLGYQTSESQFSGNDSFVRQAL